VTDPADSKIDDLPIRLILDASAVCAFGAHETVGQIIGDIEAEDECFAVTSASLAEALTLGADPRLIDLLRAHTGCILLTSTADWRSLGRFMDLTRPSATALHDVADSDLTMLAVHTEAYILTDQPARYERIFGAVTTIQLEKPWS
jgi:hypothetical protein